jgi:response regulator NasT
MLVPEREVTVREFAVAKVLTVEDDPVVRADLRLVLEDAGFEVCPDARDGVEAVELAREHRPDVILLDLGLPRLDGVEATRQIRDEHDVPIVALTGHRDGRIVERAMEAGATTYVLKPFAEHQVVGALRDALDTHAAREESRRALAHLLDLLGMPTEWAGELEESTYLSGRVWRQTV